MMVVVKCGVKMVEKIRHRVDSDGGEAVRDVRRRKLVACDAVMVVDSDGRKKEEVESAGGEGNIVVAPDFCHPFQAPRGACMDPMKGERRVGEGICRKREGGCDEDDDGACGDSSLLQTLHKHHSENIKCNTYHTS